jgi:uncharacterized RDD family membrane protein YckC
MTDSELQQTRLIAAAIDIGVSVVIMVGFWVAAFAVTMLTATATDSGSAMSYVGRILGFLGSLVSVGYVLGRDVLVGGMSLGKKTQGIRAVTTAGAPIGLMDSAKRNLFFAIGSLLGLLSATLRLLPCLGDAVACMLTPLTVIGMVVGLVVAVVEVIKIVQDPQGVRLGDAFAGTRVVR